MEKIQKVFMGRGTKKGRIAHNNGLAVTSTNRNL
jgi:hypothetical protein